MRAIRHMHKFRHGQQTASLKAMGTMATTTTTTTTATEKGKNGEKNNNVKIKLLSQPIIQQQQNVYTFFWFV